MRRGEREGIDYFFYTKEEFRRRVAQGEFAEWEEIYGNYYGTLRSEIDRALAADERILFDVDVRGGLSIKRLYPEALLIFIEPPRMEILVERLRNRKTEDPDTLRRRMERVPMELEMGQRYDHRVVNDVLERAIGEVQTIVEHYLISS
jgi:guanylate kinase